MMMRRLLIDTDCASDDAVAIIAALRDSTVHVEAITVVAGNVPLTLAVKNALVSVQIADTYAPPVYKGAAKPMMRDLFTSELVHGEDGMGNMDLPEPVLSAATEHAVDQIIALAHAYSGELEIVTLGPLTNLALAYLKAPEITQLVKQVVVMGGQGLGPGNVTPVAEYNLFVDAEAAQIVVNSGMRLMFVGWDVSTDDTFISQSDIDHLMGTGSAIAQFCIRCNHTLIGYNAQSWGKTGLDLPDPVAMMTALYPEIIKEQFDGYCFVEYRSAESYGQLVCDRYRLLNRPSNATICTKIDAARFKALLFERII
ncbi:MAG: nucleoside hydrolase [Chloroflexota bacterium]|nr:nucleoside hydrolase [Chloroflexota bacterium]